MRSPSREVPARLGPYELGPALGAGGMGEIYRARDTRLGRDVAIKILPVEFAGDADRLRRFESEARAAAALNHPNLLALYDIGIDQGWTYLVTELLDGTTLRAHLGRPIPIDQATQWAAQIADGLAATHARGIIHRDLKPENIFVTSTGTIKILDFGLAKSTNPASAEPSDDPSTTHLSPAQTEAGVVLGTPGYMAPEQVRGQAVTAQADIFAFGCVLYEMVTGRRAFGGATAMDAFSAILHAQPEPPPELPANLVAIIRRCLAKQPGERFHSAADLAFALRLGGESGRPSRGAESHFWRGLAIAATVVAVGALTTLVVREWRHTTLAPAQPGSSALSMTALTSTGDARLAQLSPDGKFVAYVRFEGERTSVWVRELASGSSVLIVPPESDGAIWGVTITPDSSFVDFVRSRSSQNPLPMDLWRVAILGGPPRKVIDDVASLPGWSPDGQQMAYFTAPQREYRLLTARPDGSGSRVVAKRQIPHRYTTLPFTSRPDTRPVWFPDGQTICVLGMEDLRGSSVYQVIRIDVATGVETELRSTGFTPGGGMVLGRDGQSFLINAGGWAAAQVVRTSLRDGTETRLTNDLATYVGVSRAGDAIVTTRRQTTTELLVLDAAGRNPRGVGRDTPSYFFGLSWIGNSRLMYGAGLAGGAGLWSTDLAGTSDFVVADSVFPSASADGRMITFYRNEIWRADADGRNASRLTTGNAAQISPDGSKAFNISGQSGSPAVWVTDLASGQSRQVSTMAALTLSEPAVSPDGRYIAFISEGTVVIMAVDDKEQVRRIQMRPTRLRWTPDGRGLTYADAVGKNLWIQPIGGEPARQLTAFADDKQISNFEWSPDGKHLAVSRGITKSDIVLLRGVQ